MKWELVRAMHATTMNSQEVDDIMRSLEEKGVKTHRVFSHTTKGTRCVRLYVSESHKNYADNFIHKYLFAGAKHES